MGGLLAATELLTPGNEPLVRSRPGHNIEGKVPGNCHSAFQNPPPGRGRDKPDGVVSGYSCDRSLVQPPSAAPAG